MPDFNNTQIAFAERSNKELRLMYWMFKMVGSPGLVRFGSGAIRFSLALHLPFEWVLKPTIFKHFCGGTSIKNCNKAIERLSVQNVKTILDYSAEGGEAETDLQYTYEQILQTIEKAKTNANIPFAVFKMTGIARFGLLEKMSRNEALNINEQKEEQRVKDRVNTLCKAAFEAGVPLMIDAEETWIQEAIDNMVMEMMRTYNRDKTIIFNTLQMYRTDRLSYFENLIKTAKQQGFYPGLKLVRGAYIEKERIRAQEMNYPSPIFDSKEQTDKAFDDAVALGLKHHEMVSLCIATHNEQSCMKAVEQMNQSGIAHSDSRIYFSQLLGMSDHISFNLAKEGYNVAKYMPYGPVKRVIPYLIRRAEENTSVGGQTSRELSLIIREKQRRAGK